MDNDKQRAVQHYQAQAALAAGGKFAPMWNHGTAGMHSSVALSGTTRTFVRGVPGMVEVVWSDTDATITRRLDAQHAAALAAELTAAARVAGGAQ